SGTSPYAYNWSPAASLDNGTIANPTSSTTVTQVYLLTVTDANLCTATSAVTVSVNPIPVADAGVNQSMCNGQSIAIGGSPTASSGTSPYAYNWSPATTLDNGTIAYPTSSTTVTQVYLLTVTDANLCTANSAVTVSANPIPVADAGTSSAICNGQSLAIGGSPTASSGTSPYTYSWSPTASLDNSIIANPTSSTTVTQVYTLTVSDANFCTTTSAVTISVNPIPMADAGTSSTICNGQSLAIGGSPTASSGTSPYAYNWSPAASLDNGTIANPTSSTTVTQVYLLTVTDASLCTANSAVTITVDPAPTANASGDVETCSDQTSYTVSGASSSNGTILWSSSGDGIFTDATINNPIYSFGTNDLLGGVFNLTMTVTGTIACGSVSDIMNLTITPAPIANASGDWIICQDQNNYTIVGATSANGNVLWTTGGDGTFVDTTIDNPTYTFGTNDTTTGLAVLTMTVTGNGSCGTDADAMNLTITDSPSISAGTDDTVCVDNPTISLNGSVTIASGGVWVTLGSGTFDDVTSLTAIYTPSASDITAGSVSIYITSTGNGGCNPVNDTVDFIIAPIPILDAGLDTTVCPVLDPIQLNGAVINALGGTWTTSSGTGAFSDPNILNPTYTPSPTDIANGSLYVVLTSTGNGLCVPIVDSILIDFKPMPTVFAGNDVTICNFTSSLTLNGTVTNVPGGVWSTTGTGSFSPNDSTLNGDYIFTAADWASGYIELVLTSYGGCIDVSDTIAITVTPFVSAGVDTAVCNGTASVDLIGQVVGATGVIWSSSGDGTFTPSTTSLAPTYAFGTSDISAGAFTLTITSTGNGGCPAAVDVINITILLPPIVDAGLDTTVCRSQVSIDLLGTVANVTGAVWSTLGSGTFTPSDSILNPTYILSSADTAANSVLLVLTTYGGCAFADDTMQINYYPGVLVDAGIDQTVCASDASVPLTGSVITATGGSWTTSGTGTFGDANSLSTDYYPSTTDPSGGAVYLILTSTGNGFCEAVSDSLLLDFIAAPVVNAGIDDTVCSLTPAIVINGSSANTSSTFWSTLGTGFFDNSSLLNTNYTPNSPDFTAGSVTLVLTGNSASCGTVTDSMTIVFVELPQVNAGTDITNCINLLGEPLSGSGNGFVSSFSWSTLGTGSFDPDAFSLTPNYVSSGGDVAAGSITLVLTGFSYGSCPAATDSVDIIYDPGPSVDAGNNQNVCADSPDIILNGQVQIATGGDWTTSGTGTFVDASDLATTYTASDADTATGTVILYLTTTGNAGCPPAIDSLELTFSPVPVANAGPDDAVCATNPDYVLSGAFGVATGAYWTSSGSGSFIDVLDMNTTYLPSPADTVAGSVFLILTTTGNGICPATIDTMELTYTADIITVFAGNDSTICADSVQLNGIVTIALGGIWTTTGGGTFSPNDSLLTANYLFSIADTTSGSVILYLTTTGNGGCAAKMDSVTYSIQDPLLISASVVDTVCAYPTLVPVAVSVTTDSVIWSTLGDGNFMPSASDTSTNYLPGTNDLSSGQVILVVTSLNNGACAARTDTSIITFIQLPTADFTSTQVCALSTTQFTDQSTSPDGITNWLWDFEAGNTSTTQNPTYSYPLGGSYNVTLTITSTYGCVDTLINPVNVDPTPAAGFISTAACFVDSVQFTDTSFVNIGSVTNWWWNFGDGDTSIVQNPTNIYPGPGTYTVTLAVTSGAGCVDTIIITTSVNPNPVADFTFTLNCVNQPIVFNDASSISNGAIVSWDWDFANTLTSTTQNPTTTFSDDNSYDIQLVVTSDSGCVDTTIQTIKPYSLPVANFEFSGLCLEDGTRFSDISEVNGVTIINWEWDFGDGAQSLEQNPDHFYANSGNYAVTFIAESPQGCVDTLKQAVPVNPSPEAAFTISPLIVELFETVEYTDQSINPVTWDWDFGDGTGTSTTQNPEYNYSDTGLFVTTLIIENQYGCPDTATGELIVVMTPIVPGGFSPDKNGKNDVIYVLGGPYTSLDFKIYNNWGELIFTSRNQSEGWDGTRDGIDQPVGVYIFTLDAIRLDGEEYKQVHGDVTLLR
ncbi:MAG: PKD domain-containing protein, partial [Flavobacteriales bacterium]|nr:PKD domain-containing protein [Flavobacteriales bacterium]